MINDECEFTYQAVRFYFKNKEELSHALGTNNAFCDSKSAKAKVIYQILNQKYDDVKTEYSWDWLKNDRTNRSMYVDFYIPSINTVIEYDGEQHYKYCPYFHRTLEQFENQVYRDKLKDMLLKEHNIRIIRIKYNDKITNSFIYNILK